MDYVSSAYLSGLSMNSSSISDPDFLVGFRQPLTASYATANSDGYATLTVQGDGIHIYDLDTSASIISQTLGPSTTFSCPAVARKIGSKFSIQSAISASSSIPQNDAGKTVWSWTDDLSLNLAERASSSKERRSVVLSHPVSKIYSPHCISPYTACLSDQGEITLLDQDLKTTSVFVKKPDEDWTTSNSFLFSQEECEFRKGNDATLILLERSTARGKVKTRIRMLGIQGDTLVREGEAEITDLFSSKIVGSSCSNVGLLSIVLSNHSIHTYQLLAAPDPLSVTWQATTLLPTEHTSNTGLSILPISTSHILIASLSSAGIQLTIFDLHFSLPISSHTFALPPSAAPSSSGKTNIHLINATRNQCILLVNSSAFLVPFSSPARSTVRDVMGLGKKLGLGPGTDGKSKQTKDDKMLASLKNTLESGGDAAKLVTEWQQTKNGEILGYPAVKSIVSLLLSPQPSSSASPAKGKKTKAQSRALLRDLISKRMIRSSMVDQSSNRPFLGVLAQDNDWESITLALTSSNVPDIPSNDLVEVLQQVVQHHRTHQHTSSQNDDDKMNVDAPTTTSSVQTTGPDGIPALAPFLSSCVLYEVSSMSATSASLRQAVRRSFVDSEEVKIVLEVLVRWVEQEVERLTAPEPTTTTPAAQSSESSPTSAKSCPPLSSVLIFLLPFLDSVFLLLSSSSNSQTIKQSQSLLRSLSASVEKCVAGMGEVERGVGVLGEFLQKLETASVVGAGHKSAGGEREVSGKRKARAREEQSSMMGLYRLEEIVL